MDKDMKRMMDTKWRRDKRMSSTHRQVFWLEGKSFGKITFPFHSYNANVSHAHKPFNQNFSNIFSIFSKIFHFPKVYASDGSTANTPKSATAETNADSENRKLTDSPEKVDELARNTEELEAVTRAFLKRESGRERVRMLFKKDHKGNSSIEMEFIKVALLQTFIISFFIRYVPTWKTAKEDWIREHHATVFRTRIEALRRMQDYIFLQAAREAGNFTAKVTFFSAGLLFISQIIASYRNKTSFLEYATAAGITGGIFRMHMGVKGFITGSLLGTFLGTFIGGLACALFYSTGIDQESRHFNAIMSKLEVERYIVGESEFRQKVQEARQELGIPAPAS